MEDGVKTSDFIETPSPLDWADRISQHPTSPATPFETTSAHIAKTLKDMSEGKPVVEEYPAVDAILKKHY